MAILSGVSDAGTETFYDVPDADLSKYELKSARLTDDVRGQLFPGKDKLTKDDAHGVIPAAPSAGADVEGYAATCMYYQIIGGTLYYWYDYC
ncbi:MAG: hypothetical protein ACRDTN_18960 [Mycobacterium sp.]